MAKVIAEIGINHNGQMDIAKNLITMAKEAGADAVKFQKRSIDIVYAGQLDAPRNDGNPYGWTTVGEQKRGIEFSLEQYKEIDKFCANVGIPWFVSCWDEPSFRLMRDNFRFDFHKIASPMLTNIDFVKEVARDCRTTFISTGGSTLADISEACRIFRQAKTPFVLMHCVSMYPCPDENLNLNMIKLLGELLKLDRATVGYSGHEVGLLPSVLAIGMGAKWIERHITIDRSMYGSDQSASMEYNGLKKLCDIAHRAPDIFGHGVKVVLDGEAANMKKLRYWE